MNDLNILKENIRDYISKKEMTSFIWNTKLNCDEHNFFEFLIQVSKRQVDELILLKVLSIFSSYINFRERDFEGTVSLFWLKKFEPKILYIAEKLQISNSIQIKNSIDEIAIRLIFIQEPIIIVKNREKTLDHRRRKPMNLNLKNITEDNDSDNTLTPKSTFEEESSKLNQKKSFNSTRPRMHSCDNLRQKEPGSEKESVRITITDTISLIKQRSSKIVRLPKEYQEKENENIIYHKPKNGERVIQFISLDLLILKVFFENYFLNNPIALNCLLESSRIFLDLEVLIDKLQKAYWYFYNSNNKMADTNLLPFLNNVILHNYRLICDKSIIGQLNKFYIKLSEIHDKKGNWYQKEISSMLYLLESKGDELELSFFQNSFNRKKYHKLISTKSFDNSCDNCKKNYFDINFWTVDELAKQLTIISRNMMLNINETEIIGARYSKKNKEETSPNIISLIKRFDLLVMFIIEDIFSYDRKRHRARALEKWIAVAMKCKEINNFNDTLVIQAVFCNYLIKKMNNTWKRVNNKAKEDLTILKHFCSCLNSYQNIRIAIDECIKKKETYLPYLGLLLKEISFYEENMPNMKGNSLVNLNKINKVSISINNFFQFRDNTCTFKSIKKLEILSKLTPKTEQELEEMSLKLEPSFCLYEKKSKEKRLTKTDISYNAPAL